MLAVAASATTSATGEADMTRSTVSTPVTTAAGPTPRQSKSSAMPGALKADEMVVVVDAKIQWACLRCPGGCGAPISLSLIAVALPLGAAAQQLSKIAC